MMKPVQDSYPVFEANQILSNLHLNQLFDYLSEQERLTRANLIGIGIVCGLDLRPDLAGATVHLARGCGITSSGYLIVEPDEVALVAYRQYTLPLEPDYAPFRAPAAPHAQYPMWEMFPAGEPDTTPLGMPAGFMNDKAAVLFLELKQEGLRNCSPNDCNDRGSKVTGSARRLLIGNTDLAAIIAASAALGGGLSVTDLEAAMSDRLNLPDLRLPRVDVPNTGPASSEQVLAAFHAVFRGSALAAHTGAALSAAYQSFKPLLQEHYPADPFAGFGARFGFLDSAPQTAAQVLFLQYYLDFFDDLILAYDEFRWKGAELLCMCCPPEQLFPRHLMLGVLAPASVSTPGLYRQGFVPACAGEALTAELLQLFQRLASMVDSFTDAPALPKPAPNSRTDPQLRITPSATGARRLADMALPYYYRLTGAAPLFQSWSPERSRRHRANQNLGYRSDEYTPPAPAFVREALRYDLAPYDFLRIEGHLGKNYQSVLRTLLALKTQYRLPIEIVAMRTGAFDETAPLSEAASFQDLETLYDTLREVLLSTLCEGVRFLYDVPIGVALPGGAPKLPLLAKRAPGYLVAPDSVGAWYEKHLVSLQARPYIDVDQNKIDANAVFTVYCLLFAGTSQLPEAFYAHVVSVYYLSKLSEALPASLDTLAYADFENKYQDLLGLTRYFRDEASKKVSADLQKFIPAEELIDHFDQVLYSCKLDAMKALHEEHLRRLRELRQKQFLGFFLRNHPGIQHKAGVPLGGTFVLVYHGQPAAAGANAVHSAELLSVSAALRTDPVAVSGALKRIGSNRELARDPDIRFLLGTLTGQALDPNIGTAPAVDEAAKVIREAVDAMPVGAVIADFFLPYICCADGAAVQYVLPPPPLGLSVALACTNPAGNAEATLTPGGGLAPIIYQLDGQPFQPLSGPVLLSAGPHTLRIRDSAGAESAPQALIVPSSLQIGEEAYTDDLAAMSYQVAFRVSGGTLPYAVNSGSIKFNSYLSAPVPSGKALDVEITDSAGCKTSAKFTHTVPKCELPCDGFARRCGYRFWLPDPDRERPYEDFGAASEVPAFRFEFPQGKVVDIGREVGQILRADLNALNSNFDGMANDWIKQINALIAKATGSLDWLSLSYERDSTGMAMLWIEYFECLDFEFHVQTFFKRGGLSQQLDLLQTPKGTTFTQAGVKPVAIPPFNCSRIAKCDPARPVTPLCKTIDMQLKITKSLANGIALSVSASGNDKPVAFLWEVQDCRPAAAGGANAQFEIVQKLPLIKQIRLSAFTQDGCMVVLRDQINIG
jgi:hypothetical protein